jgi:hypothetical protein
VVPQQAVAAAGEQERDGHLGVALDQLDDRALLVEPAVLVLAEPVEALPVAGLEGHLEPVHAAARGLVAARRRPGEVRGGLGQDLVAGRAQEPELPRGGDLGGQPAVGDEGRVRPDLDGHGDRLGRKQRSGQIVADLLPDRPADPEAARPPWLDADDLVSAPPLEGLVRMCENTHVHSSPLAAESACQAKLFQDRSLEP